MISRVTIFVWLCASILLCSASPLHAGELGRLFFSAVERKAMNEKRVSPAQKPVAAVTQNENLAPEPNATAEASQSVRLPAPRITGKVIRSSGNDTVWVNQYPQYKRAKD